VRGDSQGASRARRPPQGNDESRAHHVTFHRCRSESLARLQPLRSRRPSLAGRRRSAANPLAALRDEIAHPARALIDNPGLPTYAEATYEAEKGFERAQAVLQKEINARIDKQMQVEIGFLDGW